MKRRKAGEYPNLLARDVLSGGQLFLWRNPADKPFEAKDVWTLTANWDSLDDISSAYKQLVAEERKLAHDTAFAWDTDFGFLSPDPFHCGTGLCIEGEFHLEALHLIGDLLPAMNALEGVRFQSSSICEDGVHQAAHIFRIRNSATLGVSEKDLMIHAVNLFSDLVTQENNARRALVEDNPRILEDAIARALALLREARLLAPGELLDLLSPICLGTTLGFLDGITRTETIKMMRVQLNTPELGNETPEDTRKRDARDAALADKVNRRFASVKFNSYAEDCLM